MPYNSKAVANYFLDLAGAAGEQLTPMKLQKLVYYAHGWNLGLTGNPLLDEVVQAWSFGPVIRSLYSEFREFRADPITRKAQVWEAGDGGELTPREPSLDLACDDAHFVKSLLQKIWAVYGGFTAIQLSNMTHEPGSPWDKVRLKYSGQIPKYATIPDETIRESFRVAQR